MDLFMDNKFHCVKYILPISIVASPAKLSARFVCDESVHFAVFLPGAQRRLQVLCEVVHLPLDLLPLDLLPLVSHLLPQLRRVQAALIGEGNCIDAA